jgi:hypothetical protein
MSSKKLTPEQRAIAEMFVVAPAEWKTRLRPRPVWFMECFDQVLRNDLDKLIQLPTFPNAKDIAIFSDYGGEHDESPVYTYSFLIVDFGGMDLFGQAMKVIRAEHKLGRREISFKELNSTAIQGALPKMMRAADRLPGLLFTLVVDKRYKTVLGNADAPVEGRRQLDASGITSWQNPKELEGAVRKAHTVAYWLSMLAREGMGVFWMTDRDNIVANDAVVNDLQKLVIGALNSVAAPMFRLHGFAKEFARTYEQPYFNDALAIADLTAGAMAAAFTELKAASGHSKRKDLPIADVLTLHAHQGVFLKKLTIALDFDEHDSSAANCFWVEGTTRSRDGYVVYQRPDGPKLQ